MKLYEKGLYTYNKALNYANTDLKNYLSKPISSDEEKLHCEYELSLVINRLYYALYQMAKSYLVSKHSAKLEHRWTSVNKRLLDNKINSIQVIQNIDIATNIAIFIQSMDKLRIKRNNWDYKLSHSKNYQREYKEVLIIVKNACTSFQTLQTILGEPQC